MSVIGHSLWVNVLNRTKEINQINETDQINQIDDIEKINEINQTYQTDQTDKIDEINEIDQINDLNGAKAMKDYYKVLGIKKNASGKDIRARWIELIRKLHPDRAGEGGAEAPRLKEINEAYGVLKHSSTRVEYDLQRAFHRKKRSSFLRRLISSPGILVVLLILGLIYVQRIRVAPLAKPTFPSVRGSIDIKVNPPSSPLPHAPNELNEINRIDHTDLPNDLNYMKASFPVLKSAASVIARKAVHQEILQKKVAKPFAVNSKGNPPLSRVQSVAKPPSSILPSKRNNPNTLNEIKETNPKNLIVAQPEHPPLIATEEEVRQFFVQYREQYNQMDIEGFLSLFSSKAVQNHRDGFDEMKRIYSDFFDKSRTLWFHMKDMRIEIYQNAVQVNARYEIYQTMKKRGKKRAWRGDISWILIRENGALKIRSLDFKPQKSR